MIVLYDLLQVYVTMYLNDCQRTTFYEGIGLDTNEFDMHVIIEVKMSSLFLTVTSFLYLICNFTVFHTILKSEQPLNMDIRSLQNIKEIKRTFLLFQS